MAYRQPSTGSDPYSDYAFDGYDRDDVEYVGNAQTVPYYYSAPDDKVFGAKVNEDDRRLEPDPETERSLDATEELGEFLEEVGDAVGWESLSAWAREHLEE